MRVSLVSLAGLLVAAVPVPADQPSPRLAPERIVLHTPAGDAVLALYPDIAPRHVEQILRLVRLGAYDSTHFFRVIPNFVVQLSIVQDRTLPLTAEQRAAIQRIPAEFSSLSHH